MSSLPYLLFVGKVTQIGALITVITNTLSIYLTYFHIQNITGVYKNSILMIGVLGIAFSVVEFIAQPFVHFFDNTVIYFSADNMFGAPKALKTSFLLCYSCLYAVFICLIAIQFFYRFCLITNSKSVRFFEKANIPWLFLYVLSCVGVWAVASLQCLPDQFSMNHVKKELLEEYDCEVEDTPAFLIITYETINSTQHLHLPSVFCAIGVSSILITQYSIIIFCGIRIKMKMAEASLQMSDYTHRIQKQLFRTLILQILTPSVFHHIPVLMLMSTVFLDFQVKIPFGIMFCFFSFFPAIDSIILMCLVTEYRKVVKRIVLVILEMLTKCHKNPSRVDSLRVTTTVESSRTNNQNFHSNFVI